MWSFIILAQNTMGYFVAPRFVAPDLRLVCSYYFRTMRLLTNVCTQCARRCPSVLGLALPYEQVYLDPRQHCLVSAIGSVLLGALVIAGTQAINAVFSISITALYAAYSIPIAARWIWRKENGWVPGTFSLGAWVSVPVVSIFRHEMTREKLEC